MNTEEKRLVIDMPKTVHNQIKQIAASHGFSIKSWVMRAIMNQILRENNDDECKFSGKKI